MGREVYPLKQSNRLVSIWFLFENLFTESRIVSPFKMVKKKIKKGRSASKKSKDSKVNKLIKFAKSKKKKIKKRKK